MDPQTDGQEPATGTSCTDKAVRELPDTPLGRRLARHRQALLDAVAAAGGSDLRVFGSVARGEDGPSSDIDLLVDLPEETGLFALLALQGTLERILGVRVDLGPESGLKPRIRPAVLAEAIAL